VFDWVHVDDVAGAIKAAMTEKWSGVINVVNDQPIRIAELIDRTLSSEGLEPIRWGDDPKTASSGRRVRNTRLHALGFAQRCCRDLLEALKHQAPFWKREWFSGQGTWLSGNTPL
jgi:nucleoside-diphosphate-sugar epimerase